MKRCAVCENDYPDDVTVCPLDGSAVGQPGSPPPDAFVGRVIRGRYRVERQLGEGGMGTVYLAEQLSVGAAKVALKVLRADFARDPDFVARFRQEAKLVAALNQRRNPHVTLVHDFDQADDGSLFIVMEWLQGQVLSEVIQRQRALGLPRAVRLATQIAEGLESAHRAGVIHRDVKPHNIMVLAATDDIKLMDFGIARLRDSSSQAHLTRAGDMLGTPAYMAPEQIEGAEITDASRHLLVRDRVLRDAHRGETVPGQHVGRRAGRAASGSPRRRPRGCARRFRARSRRSSSRLSRKPRRIARAAWERSCACSARRRVA